MSLLTNGFVSRRECRGFHFLDARTKLFFMIILNIIIIIGNDAVSLAVYIAVAGLLYLSKMTGIFIFLSLIMLFWWFCFVYLFSPLLDNSLDPAGLFSGMVFKGTAMGSVTLWFMHSTTTYALSSSLEKMKIPSSITIPFTVTVRFLPTLMNEFFLIRDALRLRGVYSSVFDVIRHPVVTYNCFVVPMILRSIKMAEEIAATAETRGIGSSRKRTFLHKPEIGKADLLFSSVWVVYFIAVTFQGVF